MDPMDTLLGQPVPAAMMGQMPQVAPSGSLVGPSRSMPDPDMVAYRSVSVAPRPFELPPAPPAPHSLMDRRASSSVSSRSPPVSVEQLRARAQVLLTINRELLRHALFAMRGSDVQLAAMKRLQSNLSYLQALSDPARAASGAIPPPFLVPPSELPTLIEPYRALADMFR